MTAEIRGAVARDLTRAALRFYLPHSAIQSQTRQYQAISAPDVRGVGISNTRAMTVDVALNRRPGINCLADT
jgi:hypothetical protein